MTDVTLSSASLEAVTPYLSVVDADRSIQFYVDALGAKELYRLASPDGTVNHCELQIGAGKVFLATQGPTNDRWAPSTGKTRGNPIMLHLNVTDVDATGEVFLRLGGKNVRPIADQFFGERTGIFADLDGYYWMLAQRTEDVSPDEMKRRFDAMTGGR